MARNSLVCALIASALLGCYAPVAPPAVQVPPTGAAPACVPCPAPETVAPKPLPRSGEYDALLRSAYNAYRNGDYESAMLDYERVLGRADDPHDQIRVLISLAMIRLLPSSEMRDLEAAAIVMDELDRRIARFGLQHEFFGELELLQLINARERELRALRSDNSALKKEIANRDEVIRQLRALTVGSE